jgi:hypothetical protein
MQAALATVKPGALCQDIWSAWQQTINRAGFNNGGAAAFVDRVSRDRPNCVLGVSVGKSKELLQQSDKLIKTIPEVVSVHGKAGLGSVFRLIHTVEGSAVEQDLRPQGIHHGVYLFTAADVDLRGINIFQRDIRFVLRNYNQQAITCFGQLLNIGIVQRRYR